MAGERFSDSEKAVISKLWKDGYSATRIACHPQVGDRSRSAIIGIVHRMGLASDSRAVPQSPSPPARKPREPKAAPVPQAKPAPTSPAIPPALVEPKPSAKVAFDLLEPVKRVNSNPLLVELRSQDCRYPVGVATGAEQRFCGAPHGPGLTPYCANHQRLCAGRKPSGNLQEGG